MSLATVDELQQARREGIGGSDVAAIVGLNPYKTAIKEDAEGGDDAR